KRPAEHFLESAERCERPLQIAPTRFRQITAGPDKHKQRMPMGPRECEAAERGGASFEPAFGGAAYPTQGGVLRTGSASGEGGRLQACDITTQSMTQLALAVPATAPRSAETRSDSSGESDQRGRENATNAEVGPRGKPTNAESRPTRKADQRGKPTNAESRP